MNRKGKILIDFAFVKGSNGRFSEIAHRRQLLQHALHYLSPSTTKEVFQVLDKLAPTTASVGSTSSCTPTKALKEVSSFRTRPTHNLTNSGPCYERLQIPVV